MARAKEQDHPFYKPLWRRVLIVAVIALLLAFEIYMGSDGFWLTMYVVALAYAVYTFFITWPKDSPEDTPKDGPGPSA